MSLPRVGYIGHHGASLLYLDIHKNLTEDRSVDPMAGFITFNQYWRRQILKKDPTAVVYLFPNEISLKIAKLKSKFKKSKIEITKDIERAWKLDKILRHRPLEEVALLWEETGFRCRQFFDEFKPQIIVTELIQSLPCYAVYLESRKRGIPFVQMAGSRLQQRMNFFIDESGVPYGLNRGDPPKKESIELAKEYVKIVTDPLYGGPSYMTIGKRKMGFKSSDLRKTLSHVREQLEGGFIEPTAPGFLSPFISKYKSLNLRKRHQDVGIYKRLTDVQAISGKKLLFPLHVTPEATTDLWAPQYSNMLLTVQEVISVLPPDWTLVIKEHPGAIYLQRKQSETKSLKSLSRCVYLSPDVSNVDLFPLCHSLLVINSTMGLEAMIKGYPVITLGKPFYDLSGNTIVCPSISNLPEALEKAAHFKPDNEKTIHFLANFFESSDFGNPVNPVLFPESLDEGNTRQIAANIKNQFLSPL